MNRKLTEQEPEPSLAVKRFSKSEVQSLVQSVVHNAVKETDAKMESLLQKVQQLECEPKFDFNIRKLEIHIKKVKRRGDAAMAFLRKMQMSGAPTKCTSLNQIQTLPSAVGSDTGQLSRLDSDEEPIEIVPNQKRKLTSGTWQNLMPNEKRSRMDDKPAELKSKVASIRSPPPPDLLKASLRIEIPRLSLEANPAMREWLATVKAEPVKAEPVKTEPVKAEPIEAQLVKVEPIEAALMKAEHVMAEPVKPSSIGALKESSPKGLIQTLEHSATGSAETPRTPSGSATQGKKEEGKMSARFACAVVQDDPLHGLPPLPPTTFPSLLPAQAASYSIPSQVKVTLAYIHNPPGISVLWDLVEKDPTEPPMDSFRVCMVLEKGKGCGLFSATWTPYEVAAIPLPMAVVIQIEQKMSGRKICFAVVGKDKFGRYGIYSDIKHALLP